MPNPRYQLTWCDYLPIRLALRPSIFAKFAMTLQSRHWYRLVTRPELLPNGDIRQKIDRDILSSLVYEKLLERRLGCFLLSRFRQ